MKKILVMGFVLVLVIGMFSLPVCASIRLKGGYFMPAGSIQVGGEKVPDSGIVYGAELTTTLIGGFLGLGIGADYFPWSKTIASQAYAWNVISGLVTVYFLPSGSFYLGAGAGYYMVNAKEGIASTLGHGIGYHAVIGWNITKQIFIEGKYSICTISSWNPFNPGISEVGGITVMLGFGI